MMINMNGLIHHKVMHPKKRAAGGSSRTKTNDSQVESRENGERHNRCCQGEREDARLLAGSLQPLMLN